MRFAFTLAIVMALGASAAAESEAEYQTSPARAGRSSTKESEDFAAQFKFTPVPRTVATQNRNGYWRLALPCEDSGSLQVVEEGLLARLLQRYFADLKKEAILSISARSGGSASPQTPVFATAEENGKLSAKVVKENCALSPYFPMEATDDRFVTLGLKFTSSGQVSVFETISKVSKVLATIYTGPYAAVAATVGSPTVEKISADLDKDANAILKGAQSATDTVQLHPDRQSAIEIRDDKQDSTVLQVKVSLIDTLLASDFVEINRQAVDMASLRAAMLHASGKQVAGKTASSYIPPVEGELKSGGQFSERCHKVFEALRNSGFSSFDAAVLTLSSLEERNWATTAKLRDDQDSSCEARLSTALGQAPQLAAKIKSRDDLMKDARGKDSEITDLNFDRITRALKGGVARPNAYEYWDANVNLVNDSKVPGIAALFDLPSGKTTVLTDQQAADFMSQASKTLVYTPSKNRCMVPKGMDITLAQNVCFSIKNNDQMQRLEIQVSLSGPRTNKDVQITGIVIRDLE